MQRIELTREECCVDLDEFYNTIASKMGLSDAEVEKCCYNHCEISVTRNVSSEIMNYYREQGWSVPQRYELIDFLGPKKMSLDEKGYFAEVEDGFILGVMEYSKGIYEHITNPRFSAFINMSLRRFWNRDWGNLSDEEKALNDAALANGDRVMGSYNFNSKLGDIWIVTNAGRSATTVMFPSEYDEKGDLNNAEI